MEAIYPSKQMKAKLSCSKNVKKFPDLFIHLFIISTHVYRMPPEPHPFLWEQDRKWAGKEKGKRKNLVDCLDTEDGLGAQGAHQSDT